ncbi:50S ribosomal protein L4 [Marinitenerispora sediminis]|uniref:Large ribosomal subunit protein uL4 n=1 Tax=Marinitenerispora sediminis TaxID=1931232 RepID=A0A368TB11_9ACTN|nr:50S ribosomal protein L4 [Marinitenerispora sediminis]RCV55561.1 50S ribosomal protein L4 [Marinitenerispora sediminis]RCV61889.1 50S ribosomal protein L4 [Marinitenerispora sediminis]RCV62265.1 50S ribosomal protein L4 [Marinitenerispora sediminis]
MATIEVKNPDGAAGRSVELPGEIFDQQVNIPLIHQVVVAQEAAGRQGTHSTKTRGEVRGGGKKPYRQKGTGRARQGSIRAPQFTGGGVVHGPKPRDYSQRTPKKMKAAALRGALSDRARHGRVHVISDFVAADVTTKRTQTALKALRQVTDSDKVLVVLGREDEHNRLALRNLGEVHILDAGQVNTYDVLVADDIVFTERGYDAFLGHVQGASAATSQEDDQ